MAGRSVYLGGMIQSLEDNMEKMANRLEEVVEELINVKNVTAQGVSELNVVSSDNVAQILNNEAKQIKGTTDNVFYPLVTVNSLVNGSLKFKYDATIASSYSSSNATFTPYITVDDTTTTLDYIVSGPGATRTVEVIVPTTINKGQKIIIGVKLGGVYSTFSIEENSINVCYDKLDIVNQGGLALV